MLTTTKAETTFTVESVWEMTPSQAGVIVGMVDRKILSFPVDVYDDLMLRACGYDFSDSREETQATCKVCSKQFPALRMSAQFCSATCRKRHQRNV